jgi:hypothetical protein
VVLADGEWFAVKFSTGLPEVEENIAEIWFRVAPQAIELALMRSNNTTVIVSGKIRFIMEF